MTDNYMVRRAIPDLLDKKYYIPEYQRGYRWEETQVLDLLQDLYAFFIGDTKGQFYCLQPIVVKRKQMNDELWYEVIDGQQRLTTIRIIMQIYDQLNSNMFTTVSHKYTIMYATRPDMVDIFESIKIVPPTASSPATIDEIPSNWSHMIDSVYIYHAAKTVFKWFMEDSSRVGVFSQYFYQTADSGTKSVQVVWYETNEEKEPHDIFNRMNSLKVELSCSELIRSLFLSKTTKFDLGSLDGFSDSLREEIQKERFTNKQTSINEKWDELEQQMKDKDFQSFLTKRSDTGRNSIGLLFDLISGKYASDKAAKCEFLQLRKDDELYTYLYFKKLIDKDNDAWYTWERVLSVFEKLQYWYHDRDLYHRIGFLNAIASPGTEDDVICSLLNSKIKRSVLKEQHMVNLIKDAMTLPKDKGTNQPIVSLEQLRYDVSTHYKYIKKLLLLYNVETTRLQKEGNFFSFDRFRYKYEMVNGKEERADKTWTLEHIHAQNSDCLPDNNKDSWYKWIVCNKEALKKMSLGSPELTQEQKNIIEALERDEPICCSKTYGYDKIKALFDDVARFYDLLDAKADKAVAVHQLSNMTLLDLEQNAMVGKSPFEVKRQLICNEISSNKYYPICTQKVFLKMYNQEELQIHSWGQRDRILYYEDIKKKLAPYIVATAL